MRLALALALLLATATHARADAKIQGMTPGFTKERSACQVEVRGLARVLAGAQELQATLAGGERDALAADVTALTAAHATVAGYCTEVEALVAFLEANASTAYKTVEKELDGRDNTVRRLRKDARKAIADSTPITRRLIPRLKRTPAPAAPLAVPPTAFPSKRSVVLPPLDGTWTVSGSATTDVASYTDKAGTALSVTARPFAAPETCATQRTAFAAHGAPTELAPPAAAKQLGVAWSARVITKAATPHALLAMCVERKQGSVLATADIAPATRRTLDEQLTALMIAMLTAQLEGRP